MNIAKLQWSYSMNSAIKVQLVWNTTLKLFHLTSKFEDLYRDFFNSTIKKISSTCTSTLNIIMPNK